MTIADPQLDRLLRNAAQPAIASGRAGKQKAAIGADWDQVKERAMYHRRRRKCAGNRELRGLLLGAAPAHRSCYIVRQAPRENQLGGDHAAHPRAARIRG